jgi:hypothetical protein
MAQPIGGLALQLLCGPAGTTRTWLLSSRAARTAASQPQVERRKGPARAQWRRKHPGSPPKSVTAARLGSLKWTGLEGRDVPAEHWSSQFAICTRRACFPFARVHKSHLCAPKILVCREPCTEQMPDARCSTSLRASSSTLATGLAVARGYRQKKYIMCSSFCPVMPGERIVPCKSALKLKCGMTRVLYDISESALGDDGRTSVSNVGQHNPRTLLPGRKRITSATPKPVMRQRGGRLHERLQ